MARRTSARMARELDELFHETALAMSRASGTGMVAVVDEADLTIPQIMILRLLVQGQQTVSGLSEEIRLTPGAVSRLVDRMVRKGFVSRREGAGDRRRKVFELTAAGRRVYDRLERARNGSFSDVIARLDSSLAADLKGVLTRVVATLRSSPSTTRRTPS